MLVSITLRTLAVMALTAFAEFFPANVAFGQEGDWIYDVFVDECRKAGGSPASSLNDYRRGEQFRCDQNGAGRSGTALTDAVCETEAKEGVDWVFRDAGARATYARALQDGRTPFDSVVHAQGHNPSAQAVLRRCRGWTEAYLADIGEVGQPRPLSAKDCECISVEQVRVDARRRAVYRISNSCDPMHISIRFGADILSLTGGPALSSWVRVGTLARGAEARIFAPDRKFSTMVGIALENPSSSFSCTF